MKQRFFHIKAAIVFQHPFQQCAPGHGFGFHDGGDKVVFRIVEHLDLIAQFLEQGGEGPWRIHRPIGQIGLPIPSHAVGFFQRFRGFVIQPHDELRLGENIGLAQQANGLFVLGDGGFLVELVQFQLGCGLGAKADMHQTRLAIKAQQIFVAHNVGDAGVDAPLHPVWQIARDQFVAEFDEFAAVDGGFFIGQNEKSNTMVFYQILDFIDHFLGVAHAVVAPEFPLAAEAAGKGAAAGHAGDGHAPVKGDIDVFFPFQQRPVGCDGVKLFHRGGGGGGHNFAPVDIGQTFDFMAVFGPVTSLNSAHQRG